MSESIRQCGNQPDAISQIQTWLDSEAVKDVLSNTCLDCARYAHLYQELGEGPKTRAEDEQSFMLRKWLGFAYEYGDKWREAYGRELDSIITRVKDKRSAANAGGGAR